MSRATRAAGRRVRFGLGNPALERGHKLTQFATDGVATRETFADRSVTGDAVGLRMQLELRTET
jgi:hypothetical protein